MTEDDCSTRWLHASGDMADRIRAHDWASTPIGPIQHWPPNLRCAVQIMLASTTPIAIGWGPELIILFNDACAPIYRREAKSVLGQPAKQVWSLIWDTLGPQTAQVMSGGGAVKVENQRFVFDFGEAPEEIWLDYSFNPIYLDDGTVGGIFNITTEITSRKQKEIQRLKQSEQMTQRALHESAERFELVNKATQDVVWDWDLAKGQLHWSEATLRNFGFTQEEMGTDIEDWSEKIHPEDRQRVIDDITKALDEGASYWHDEYRFLNKDGTYRFFLDRGLIARDASGKAYRMIGSMQDVTERKNAEEALRRSEKHYRELFESIDEGFCIIKMIFDDNGKPIDYLFVEVNSNFERHAGLHNVVGRTMRELVPAIEQYWFDIYGQVTTTGRPIRFENQAEEMGRWYEVYAWPYGQANNHCVAVLFTDITYRKQNEEQQKMVRTELERRVKERTDELKWRADQLAHLTSELTLIEQRERRRLAQILHDHLQQLLVAAKLRLKLIARKHDEADRESIVRVGQLLDEAIKSSRSLTVELSPPILHDAGLAAGLEWLARWMHEKHNFEVEVQIEKHDESIREDVRVFLFQAVRELLFNAVKHAKVNKARVHLEEQGENLLRVTVEDEGCGFNPDKLFTRNEEIPSGFGLFSIRERLTLLGGEFEIDSAPGRGARFTLLAPRFGPLGSEHVKAILPQTQQQHRKTKIRHAKTRDKKSPIRLLLVEDHAVVRQALSTMLDEEPDLAVVGEASDGIEGVEQALELEPDVVLMDFSLPRLDGVEATRRIHEARPDTKVIALSMYAESDRAASMLNAGAVTYLTKSGDYDLLLKTIREAKSTTPNGA